MVASICSLQTYDKASAAKLSNYPRRNQSFLHSPNPQPFEPFEPYEPSPRNGPIAPSPFKPPRPAGPLWWLTPPPFSTGKRLTWFSGRYCSPTNQVRLPPRKRGHNKVGKNPHIIGRGTDISSKGIPFVSCLWSEMKRVRMVSSCSMMTAVM